ncbi:hypothetical protein H4Q26_003291 [Puccinia striiformis f. sp. tritici PST-130]|nr:hypothetical protein H4Q26_003291 [Puccinia striiformis f. sp. tritici PST-130]
MHHSPHFRSHRLPRDLSEHLPQFPSAACFGPPLIANPHSSSSFQGPSLPFIPTGTLTSVPMPMLTSRHVSLLTPAGRWQPSHESDIEIMTSPKRTSSERVGTLCLPRFRLERLPRVLEIPMPPLTSGRLSSLSHAPLAAFRGPSLTSLPTGTHLAGRWQPSKESDIEIMTGPKRTFSGIILSQADPPNAHKPLKQRQSRPRRRRTNGGTLLCGFALLWRLIQLDTTRSIIFPNVSNNSLTVLHWDGVYDVARESQFLNNLNEWDTNVLKSNAMESGRRGLNEIVEILKVQKTRDKFADAALLVVMNQFRLCLNVILQMVEEGLPGVYITVEHDIPGVARKLLGFLLEEKNVNIFK